MRNAHFTSSKLCLACQSLDFSILVNKHTINPKDGLSKSKWMIYHSVKLPLRKTTSLHTLDLRCISILFKMLKNRNNYATTQFVFVEKKIVVKD